MSGCATPREYSEFEHSVSMSELSEDLFKPTSWLEDPAVYSLQVIANNRVSVRMCQSVSAETRELSYASEKEFMSIFYAVYEIEKGSPMETLTNRYLAELERRYQRDFTAEKCQRLRGDVIVAITG